MGWVNGIINSMDMSLRKLQEIVRDREPWCASLWGHKESHMTEQLNNNTEEIKEEIFKNAQKQMKKKT